MKSILQEKDGTCYLCRKLYGTDSRQKNIEEHHVFGGTANRKLSEKYGLKVYLCIAHHREGPEAVHQSRRYDLMLKEDAQEAFEQNHTRQEFVNIFGRNWLEEDPVEQAIAEWEENYRQSGQGKGLDAAGRG